MTTLNATLTALAESFAKHLLEAVRNASLAEILAEAGVEPSRGATSKPTKAKGAARTRAGHASLSVDAIVAVLRAHKDGLRAELLRRELGAPKPAFNYHVAKALAEKRITKRGVKRSTTYALR